MEMDTNYIVRERSAGATVTALRRGTNRSWTATDHVARTGGEMARPNLAPDARLDLAAVGLPVWVPTYLAPHGIVTRADLARHTRESLLKLYGVGPELVGALERAFGPIP